MTLNALDGQRMAAIGWASWALLFLITIGFTRPVTQGAIRSFGCSVLLWWVLLGWTIATPLAKWNILWLAPLVATLPTALLFYYALHVQRGPGMVVWVATFLTLLAFITFWMELSPVALPASWRLGLILGALRISVQLTTNHAVARTGGCPKWVSGLYFVGLLGGTGAFLWSLTIEGWKAAVPVLLFVYLLSSFVPSALRRIPGQSVSSPASDRIVTLAE